MPPSSSIPKAAAGIAAADAAEQTKPNAKQSKKPPSLASAVSGAISGSLISACVQPLDVIRTKMQADAARGVVRSSLTTAGVVLSEQGLRGFWAGTGPSVIRVGLGAGMHFVLLEQIRWLLSTTGADGQQHLSNMGAAMSGGISRAIAAVLLCPVTVVKTRMEYVADVVRPPPSPLPPPSPSASAAGTAAATTAGASHTASTAAANATRSAAAASTSGSAGLPQYRDTFHALSTIVRTEGVRGVFRGVWPTVFTNAPYSGLYYMFYMRLKENLSDEGRPQAAVNFASGVAAAVAATLLTQPADVVRTRMQLGLAGPVGAAATGPAAGAAAGAGAWGTLREALRQQGPAALMTGAAPRILKRTTQTALVWTLYEELVPRITQLGVAARAAWEQRAAAEGAARAAATEGGNSGGGDR